MVDRRLAVSVALLGAYWPWGVSLGLDEAREFSQGSLMDDRKSTGLAETVDEPEELGARNREDMDRALLRHGDHGGATLGALKPQAGVLHELVVERVRGGLVLGRNDLGEVGSRVCRGRGEVTNPNGRALPWLHPSIRNARPDPGTGGWG